MSQTIICYDITCPRRLGRIHRLLKKRAFPLQYSVFLFSGTELELQRCLAKLRELMDPRHDDIRAYPLPQRGLRVCMGRSTLPEGIRWGGLPEPWQSSGRQPEALVEKNMSSPTMTGDDASPFLIV